MSPLQQLSPAGVGSPCGADGPEPEILRPNLMNHLIRLDDIVVSVEHPKTNLEGFQNEKLRIFRYWRSCSAGAVCGLFTFFTDGTSEFVGPEQPRRSAEGRSVRRYIGGSGNPQQRD